MTNPMRAFLLNAQISSEARRIAHMATLSCNGVPAEMANRDEYHTAKCNALKREIETLALQVKLATIQRSVPRKSEEEKQAEPAP